MSDSDKGPKLYLLHELLKWLEARRNEYEERTKDADPRVVRAQFNVAVGMLRDHLYPTAPIYPALQGAIHGDEPVPAVAGPYIPSGQKKRADDLVAAVTALYYSAYWHPDRPVDAGALWTAVRDAAGLTPGLSAEKLGPDRGLRPEVHEMKAFARRIEDQRDEFRVALEAIRDECFSGTAYDIAERALASVSSGDPG